MFSNQSLYNEPTWGFRECKWKSLTGKEIKYKSQRYDYIPTSLETSRFHKLSTTNASLPGLVMQTCN